MISGWHKMPNVEDEFFPTVFGNNLRDCFNIEELGGYALELCIDPGSGECLGRLNDGKQLDFWMARQP